MQTKTKVVNIEAGMPTTAVAEKRVTFEISTAKREGITVLKIIHGYGSTGVGGRLKESVTRLLGNKKREGVIKAFVGGEDWNIFNPAARKILEACSTMGRDRDLGNHNMGITIVLL